jgi:hypothetical protein
MTTHNPSFTLKKISHDEILKDYLSGKFKDIRADPTIRISQSKGILCQEFSNDPNTAVYVMNNNKFDSPILASTNQRAFDVYCFNQKKENPLCFWCRRKFSHDSVGMVVYYKTIVYTNPSTKDDMLYEVFWVYGSYDCFECALADIRERRKARFTTHVFNYDNSEVYTKILYSLVTGKNPDELKPACHWELMEHNGGSVQMNDTHRYVQTNGVHLAPLKIFYEKRDT